MWKREQNQDRDEEAYYPDRRMLNSALYEASSEMSEFWGIVDVTLIDAGRPKTAEFLREKFNELFMAKLSPSKSVSPNINQE